MKEKNFFNLKDMVLMALFAALTCVLAPLAVPIGPVPISLTNLVIYFSLYVLGWQRATITYIVYLLLGLVGLPVFSGFEGGVGKVAGPTGGYLIGFIFMAIVCGLLMQVKKDKKIVNIVFCLRCRNAYWYRDCICIWYDVVLLFDRNRTWRSNGALCNSIYSGRFD